MRDRTGAVSLLPAPCSSLLRFLQLISHAVRIEGVSRTENSYQLTPGTTAMVDEMRDDRDRAERPDFWIRATTTFATCSAWWARWSWASA